MVCEKKRYMKFKNADLQLMSDILKQNKSDASGIISAALFGGLYWGELKIDKDAFSILTNRDKEILRNPKYYPLYYGGELIKTDWIYKDIRKKLLDEGII